VPGSVGFGARGVLASVGSAVAFAGIYFITPFLHPISAEGLWAIRAILTVPIIVLALLVVRQWHLVTQIWQRIKRKPILLPALLVCGLAVSVQLWLFGWAPLHGRGIQVALGYFLLPLVLVVIGRFLYKDRLTWWHWTAAGVAAVGVGYELVRAGGFSWETVLVVGGYPIYFVLRRAIGTANLGGMFWELGLLAPLAIVLIVLELVARDTMAVNPMLWWLAPVFAIGSGIALILYVTASRLLALSLFGLLSYLEPALLMVASFLNGEQVDPAELPMYIAIWIAVLTILVGGTMQIIRSRRT